MSCSHASRDPATRRRSDRPGPWPAPDDGGGPPPELRWLRSVAADCGRTLDAEELAEAESGWRSSRRKALLDPPGATISALLSLRAAGLRLGVLSNTHGLEMDGWPSSPVAPLVDVVGFSHLIGTCKPAAVAYGWVLQRLGVSAGRSVYVGDGGSEELPGAREAGFAHVVVAVQCPRRSTPEKVPALQAQTDASVESLADLPALVDSWR